MKTRNINITSLILKFLLFLVLAGPISAPVVAQPLKALVAKKAVAGYDTDAQAFFTALEADGAPVTLTGPQKGYINTFVLALKSASIWTGMVAIYPIIGGTAASHSYNLKNPALYKITWVATPTMSANGVQYNGSTQYGNTGMANNVLTQNSNHISLYSRTNNSAGERDMGVRTGVFWGIELYNAVFYSSNCTAASNYVTSSATRTDGLFINTRTGASAMATTRNAAEQATGTATSTTPGTTVFYVGAVDDAGTATHFTTKQHCFYSFGPGLDATAMTNLWNAVQALQTSLGRNV